MIEDKLEPAQRIRLESLSQAVQVTAMGSVGGMLSALIPGNEERPPTSAELVIELASRFERWITEGGTRPLIGDVLVTVRVSTAGDDPWHVVMGVGDGPHWIAGKPAGPHALEVVAVEAVP